jgi:Protein of unknown function (DUF1664)
MSIAAGGALRTLTMAVGAGYAGSYMSSNSLSLDSVRSLAADILMRHGARTTGSTSSPAPGSDAPSSASADIQALSAQVERLSREVNRAGGRPVVVVGTPDAPTVGFMESLASTGWNVVLIVLGGAVVYVCVRRGLGYSVTDLLWVSRNAFNTTVDGISSGVEKVSQRVGAVRKEVSEKLRNVEHRLESVRAGLGKMIESEIADVKNCVDGVHRNVEDVQDTMQNVNERIEMLDSKLDTANSGIFALIRCVASLAPDALPIESPFSELRRFAALASVDKAGRLAVKSNPAFLSHNIPSSFAAAALEGASDCSQLISPVLSRRDSMPRHKLPPTPT